MPLAIPSETLFVRLPTRWARRNSILATNIGPAGGQGKEVEDLNVTFVRELYTRYQKDLAAARAEQRDLYVNAGNGWKAQLDDIEAELTYLRVRHHQPKVVVEVGSLHGWSTTWILRALRDNGQGTLHTFDLIDNVTRTVPTELGEGRWEFHHGDIREKLDELPTEIGYLFIDAAHTGRFAKWYTQNMLPRIEAGTPVSIHDVFHHRVVIPGGEPAVALKWLRERDTPWFTAARAKAPEVYKELIEFRNSLEFGEHIHHSQDNPMIFFNAPG